MRQFKMTSLVACILSGCSAGYPLSQVTSVSHRSGEQGAEQSVSSAELPLHTFGRFIVDARGVRLKLASVNWYGASDTRLVVGGLDKAPLNTIVLQIKRLGFNSVRLPFSNLMLHSQDVDVAAVAANPDLVGLSPLVVYDRVVSALTDAGIYVIINNHTTHPMWCCNFDPDGLWYTRDYSENQWLDDWAMMAKRYIDNPMVIAADLRNEVRISRFNGILPSVPNWGKGGKDWRLAAEKAGARVLAENPNLLVVVEGLNFPREHLQGVENEPIRLPLPDRLVYAAHSYGFISPSTLGQKYADMEEAQLHATVSREWGYVVSEARHFTAPVWVSEFGEAYNASNQRWFGYFVNYLREQDLDFAYWALNPGPKASGDEELFGLLHEDWQEPISDWRTEQLSTLMAPRLGPGVEPGWEDRPKNHFTTLVFSDFDSVQSRDRRDWMPQAFKARCREGERIVGISSVQRGGPRANHGVLCSDYGLGLSVSDVAVVPPSDSGRIECEDNHYLAGLAQTRVKGRYRLAGGLCATSGSSLGRSCRKVLFEKLDQRLSQIPGDWDPAALKGQCDLGEYIAGVGMQKGVVTTLTCCQ
ncbi:MAG: glycoside hydrolase family 5 protein [Deltaproteobacteria bacterium]|nr:glycoside hydrolase family 5 protein [Deltaproteobacteria bacterium]